MQNMINTILLYSNFNFWGITSREVIWTVAQLHLNFAAFVVAIPTFAIIVEIIGFRNKEAKYDKLAKDFARLISVSLSLTSMLGAIFLFGLIAFYPKVITHLANVFNWSMLLYGALFFGELFFAYLYYYSWDKLQGNKKMRHIIIGLLLNVFGLTIMFIANSWTAYTMMPNGVNEAGDVVSRWAAFNNHGWWPLNIHRLIANLAFGGAIVASYAAANFISSVRKEDKAYYDWMGYVGNFIAVSALIPLPFAGYWLGMEIYAFDQQMGITMMGGVLSWLWIVQAVIIGVLFLSLNYYLWVGMERMAGAAKYKKFIPWLLGVITLCIIVWITPHSLVASLEEARKIGSTFHPVLSVLGIMTAKNTVVNLMLLTTYLSFIIYQRSNKVPVVQWVKQGNIAFYGIIGIAAAIIIFLGVKGYFVETIVRIGYSIYQVLIVLAVFVVCSVLNGRIYKGAKSAGEIKWGNMPARSQYILIVIAVSFTWLMGLMGFVRSSVRLNWHVYRIMEDTSANAFVPSLGFAAKMVSFITIVFFIMVGVVFYLAKVMEKKKKMEVAKA